MIPFSQIIHWRNIAPWPDDVLVEQDLIASRLLIEIFSNSLLQRELAFRGGTALYKLFLGSVARCSAGIDLVITNTEPIDILINTLRTIIDPWLGLPKEVKNAANIKLIYFFQPENFPSQKQRIKIEISTRENFSCFKRLMKKFVVESDWFSGEAYINTFQFEEIIATKLRALYQRKKSRDIFDLWLALKTNRLNIDKVIEGFKYYMQKEGTVVTQKMFIKNLEEKLQNNLFIDDISALLFPDFAGNFEIIKNWKLIDAVAEIKAKLLLYLPISKNELTFA